MDNFTAISRHPIFSKSIKKIVYDAALNDASLLDLEIYKEVYDFTYSATDEESDERSLDQYREMYDFTSSPTDEESYQRSLDQYREVFYDQQAILDTGEVFAVLKAGMDLLPNAKSFLVLDGLPDRWFWHWYHITGSGGWGADPTFPRSSLYSRDNHPVVSWDLRVVRSIIRAISLSDTRIEKLALGAGGLIGDAGLVPFTPTQFTGVDSGHARSALRSLTNLSIQFKPSSDFNSGLVESHVSHSDLRRSSLKETRALVGWISDAHNLTELILEFGPALDWNGSRELLETALWPSLRAVRLANIRCYTFLAVEFLMRHTLKVEYLLTSGAGGLEVCRELAAFNEVRWEELLTENGQESE